jgi:large subunit ribosomal protein L32
MAVPTGKTSHKRKSSRRSANYTIKAPALTKCPSCGALTAPHKACTACGKYKGRQVVVMDDATASK